MDAVCRPITIIHSSLMHLGFIILADGNTETMIYSCWSILHVILPIHKPCVVADGDYVWIIQYYGSWVQSCKGYMEESNNYLHKQVEGQIVHVIHTPLITSSLTQALTQHPNCFLVNFFLESISKLNSTSSLEG